VLAWFVIIGALRALGAGAAATGADGAGVGGALGTGAREPPATLGVDDEFSASMVAADALAGAADALVEALLADGAALAEVVDLGAVDTAGDVALTAVVLKPAAPAAGATGDGLWGTLGSDEALAVLTPPELDGPAGGVVLANSALTSTL
jgi:hypothetical protein